MKKFFYVIFTIIIVFILLQSCERVEDPVISDFSLVNDTVRRNTNTEFNIDGDADFFVFWAGVEGSNSYSTYLEQLKNITDTVNVTRDLDRGESVVPGAEFTYRYTAIDTVVAVLIATNYGDNGNEIKQVKKELTIIIQ